MKFLPVLFWCALVANAAEVKISELPETNAPSASAVIPIVDAGANWKVQKANLLGSLTNWAKLSTNAGGIWVFNTTNSDYQGHFGILEPIDSTTNEIGGRSVLLYAGADTNAWWFLRSNPHDIALVGNVTPGDGDETHVARMYFYAYGDGINNYTAIDFNGYFGPGLAGSPFTVDPGGQDGLGTRYLFGSPDLLTTDDIAWFRNQNSTVGKVKSDGSVLSSGLMTGTLGFSSLATDAFLTFTPTGITNTLGKIGNARFDGTNVTYVVKNNAGTPVYTNAVSVGHAFEQIQAGGAIVVTVGTVIGTVAPQ